MTCSKLVALKFGPAGELRELLQVSGSTVVRCNLMNTYCLLNYQCLSDVVSFRENVLMLRWEKDIVSS